MTTDDSSSRPDVHYDRVTPAWGHLLGDELHYGLFDHEDEDLAAATRHLTDRMATALALQPGLELLDVGTGTGGPACHLAQAHAVSVTGISTSAVGIEAARERAASLGLTGSVAFAERDGMDNGFPDASFDRVLLLECAHLMRDRQRLVDECARVLRPGGRLALCDIVLRRPMPFDEVRRLRRPLAVLRDVFGDAHMEELATLADRARTAGLDVVEEADVTASTRPTFERWRANAAAHAERVVASIGQQGLDDFVEACDVLQGFWDDGTLGYGILAAARP